MRVAELQMYRETAFERDGRDSNENAPRVYSQRPPSQAEADVADLYTIIIMPPRRSCTAQSKPYTFGPPSDDEDDNDETMAMTITLATTMTMMPKMLIKTITMTIMMVMRR